MRRITSLVALAIIILTILLLSVGDRSIQGISVGRVLTYIISVLSVVLPVLLVIRVGRYVWTSWQGAGQRWRDAGAAWDWKRSAAERSAMGPDKKLREMKNKVSEF